MRVINIDNHKVVVENFDGEYLLYLKDYNGGPIISQSTFKSSVGKFKEALQLSIAVKKLLEFKRTRSF